MTKRHYDLLTRILELEARAAGKKREIWARRWIRLWNLVS